MISKETKTRTIRMIMGASFLFFIGSFFTKYLVDDYLAWPTFVFCLTIFFIAGSLYVASFLSILDDRKDFIKIIKEDFSHIYKKTKIHRKS